MLCYRIPCSNLERNWHIISYVVNKPLDYILWTKSQVRVYAINGHFNYRKSFKMVTELELVPTYTLKYLISFKMVTLSIFSV